MATRAVGYLKANDQGCPMQVAAELAALELDMTDDLRLVP